jgi:hypothetical protein
MGGWRELGRRVGEKECVQGFDRETQDYFENLEADGRIILKWIVGKYEGME